MLQTLIVYLYIVHPNHLSCVYFFLSPISTEKLEEQVYVFYLHLFLIVISETERELIWVFACYLRAQDYALSRVIVKVGRAESTFSFDFLEFGNFLDYRCSNCRIFSLYARSCAPLLRVMSLTFYGWFVI